MYTRISVIVPVYNVERFLPECIESICAQTYRNLEIILVDDGSPDRCGAICDEYAAKDARVRVIHKDNTGQADSRNIAIGMAKAPLIGFVDSDDWIDPDMYETLYRTMVENDADISMCGHYLSYVNHERPSCQGGCVNVYEGSQALQMILDRLFDTTMENMDISPTITPVLDLSQVEAGITSMNGMFDNNSSYGLAFGNATAYNNGLSAKFAGMKVQNEYDGVNVVDAVNSLRNDISEIKTAMGTLGFYVDGKQMATAIADPMNSALNKIAVNTGRGVK